MKLFICNQGKNRSKTAAEMFRGNYAGIYSEENPLTEELLQKAEIVYVFENKHREYIAEHFPIIYLKKKILNLNIPDIYKYNQKKLQKIIKKRM